MTIAGRMNRSTGTVAPNAVTVPLGSTGGCGFVAIPKASDTAAWATRSTPRDAASFASGDAVLSGRKATNSISTPRVSRTISVNSSAGAVGTCHP